MMLSVIDVIKSLSILIQEKFPSYPVIDRDVDENIPRPSCFIDVSEVRGNNITFELVKEEADYEVFFFAEDRYKGFLELLDMKNQILEYLSEPLALTDDNGNIVAHVVFNDVNCILDKSDKCLQCTMTSEIVQQRNIKESEYDIEYIEFKM